ncbi:hypothetical protein [Lysobacter gummosus]
MQTPRSPGPARREATRAQAGAARVGRGDAVIRSSSAPARRSCARR